MRPILLLMSFTALAFLSNSCGSTLPVGVLKENYIHKYGVELSKKDWESRGRHGKIISTMKDGIVITKTYDKGILHGETAYSFPYSNTIEKKELFDQGKLASETRFFSTGIPMWEEKFLADNKSIITTWYEDGTPQSIEEYHGKALAKGDYFSFKNEIEARVAQQEGTRIHRDAFGNLLSKDFIKNGEMVLRTTYHPNGDPKTVTSFEGGVPHGQKKTFWMGGLPNTVEEWRNGIQHGITTVFQNGEKNAEIPYVDGIKHGLEKRFREGEVLAEEIAWDKGHKHGPSKTYLENEVATTWFHQDKAVSKLIFEDLNHAR